MSSKPSEIEIWLADGPHIEEIVERFEKLEEELEAVSNMLSEHVDMLLIAEKDYAMLQKGLCGTNAELSMAWHKMDLLKEENVRLRKGLTVALDSVQWMADAIDADQEDRERLAFVVKALMEGEYGE